MADPCYREVKNNVIPEVSTDGGGKIKIVTSAIAGERGPTQDIIIDPEYLDVTVPAESEFVHPTSPGCTAVAFVFLGTAYSEMTRKLS